MKINKNKEKKHEEIQGVEEVNISMKEYYEIKKRLREIKCILMIYLSVCCLSGRWGELHLLVWIIISDPILFLNGFAWIRTRGMMLGRSSGFYLNQWTIMPHFCIEWPFCPFLYPIFLYKFLAPTLPIKSTFTRFRNYVFC